jgi:hypothetical protein
MSIFTHKNQKPLEFDSHIDLDGDLRLTVNGIDLLYISKNDGKLYFFCVALKDQEGLSGLAFNESAELARE